ncbi:MAG: hypothetical protein HYX67_14645 [Candidatus Melainabacteria bacterium]|nr:hypothetical protein [Candidatus Melainabacteria bacterium]
MIRKVLLIFAVFAAFVGLQQLVEIKTRGFCLQKILADDLPYQARWETPPLASDQAAEVEQLLSQPYRLIGAGSECYAFKSEDGLAVIKFFKLDHARPVYFQKGLLQEDHSALAGTLSTHPLTQYDNHWLKRFLGIREFRIQRTFNSIKLAYDELKDETGLIYLHLNPTTDLNRTLTLIDACGIHHKIDLDHAKFFLQKRAIPLEKHFSLLRGKDELAKKSIDSLVEMLLVRCKKGFADRDILNRNLGYIGTQAIEIDSGSFMKNPKMREPWLYKQELFYATLELKLWLKKHYPEMVGYLEERVNQEIVRDM